jgi:putative peptidoglycan lipid II flippase
LAISISAVLNAWLLYRGLRREGVITHSSGWRLLLMQVVAAIFVMGACLVTMARPLDWWITANVMDRSIWLVVSVVAGGAVYFAVLLVLGLRPANLRLRSA